MVEDLLETIRIKGGKIHIDILTFSGKEGDHYIFVSPSINVSGYGSTREEAIESFKENVQLFCADLMKLSVSSREAELFKMGFSRVKLQNKNFSKSYIDSEGVLQGFEPGTVGISRMVDAF